MSRKEQFGVCHICGQQKKLTYEHIPPQAGFNSTRQRLCTVDTLLNTPRSGNRPPWDTAGLRYQQFQQGTGFYTLCGDCNSYTGSKYGTTYSQIIQRIGSEILRIPKDERGYGLDIHIENVNLLAFFKQVLSMFCSINTPEFGAHFRTFLLDENSTEFDQDRYKIFMYLHAGKVVRYVPYQVQADVETGNVSAFSEISTFPVGFILYDVSGIQTKEFRGCDITPFSTCPYRDIQFADMSVPFLTCDTPFGLDFRSLSK
ncbi:MAG: hypothetical protein K2F83_00140 [Oscillospiraceae bacterium]|nr:hypothetical protein [Oscillospiraceae bacterium]